MLIAHRLPNSSFLEVFMQIWNYGSLLVISDVSLWFWKSEKHSPDECMWSDTLYSSWKACCQEWRWQTFAIRLEKFVARKPARAWRGSRMNTWPVLSQENKMLCKFWKVNMMMLLMMVVMVGIVMVMVINQANLSSTGATEQQWTGNIQIKSWKLFVNIKHNPGSYF